MNIGRISIPIFEPILDNGVKFNHSDLMLMSSSVTNSWCKMRSTLSLCGQYVVMSLIFCQAVQAESVDYEAQKIRVAITQEPPNLNSIRTTDLLSYMLLGHMTEGLLAYDRRGKLIPAIAKSWELSPLSMVFHLREDAKWSDGSPVTAHDFVFAWRTVNDPNEASPFAAIMYPIKNARRVQQSELPLDQLGVKAIDKHTLLVEFEQECGYCLSLMPHGTFFPVKQSFYESKGSKFGSEAEHLIANGPFVMSEWVHESHIVLQKNRHYWDRSSITLNEIDIAYITSDNRTRLNLFRDDQIAFVRLGPETVKDAVDQRLKLRTFLTGGVAYMTFNFSKERPTSHKKLRQAIQAVIDTDEYVNKVVAIPGYKPAISFFPSWFQGESRKFVDEYPPRRVSRNLRLARQLAAELRADIGEIPSITLLTVSSPTGAKVAEYFQGVLGQSLGLEVLVDQQSFKQYLNKSRQRDFDIALGSWFPDFNDLVTYADLLGSYNPNNRGNFQNVEYDRWLGVLQKSLDPKQRFAAVAEMQRIIIDEVPLLPTAETGSAYLQHRKLKGVVRRVIGQDPDFSRARVIQ